MELPDKATLRKLKNAKITKYLWVPETLAKKLLKQLPEHLYQSYDDLYAAGMVELVKQVSRLYDDPALAKKYWNPKKNDLTVGPFFLKGLGNPYPQNTDPGSIKFIKGAILDELRKLDLATPHERKQLKVINKYKTDYQKMLGRTPTRRMVKEKFNLTDQQYDELLYADNRDGGSYDTLR